MKNFIPALAISIYWGLLTLALAFLFSALGFVGAQLWLWCFT